MKSNFKVHHDKFDPIIADYTLYCISSYVLHGRMMWTSSMLLDLLYYHGRVGTC